MTKFKFDAKQYTNEELKNIAATCTNYITLRSKIEKVLKDEGLTVADILQGGAKQKRSSVAAKWRHQENHTLTWSGRGRQPKWIKKYGVKIG